MADSCYVYAIVPPSIRLPDGLTGFGGRLRVVAWRDLAAVVSSPGGGEIEPAPEHLLRHERIVEAICGTEAALPVRFGTVLASSDSLRRALAEQHDTLLDDLRRLAGTLEFGVTALWRHDPDGERPSNTDESVPRRDLGNPATEEVGGRGTAYLRARLADHWRAGVLQDQARALGAELDAALRPHAIQRRRTLCPSDRLALRDVYLTTREWAGAFEKAAEVLRGRHTGAHLLVSGPWPPYSFVTAPHG